MARNLCRLATEPGVGGEGEPVGFLGRKEGGGGGGKGDLTADCSSLLSLSGIQPPSRNKRGLR